MSLYFLEFWGKKNVSRDKCVFGCVYTCAFINTYKMFTVSISQEELEILLYILFFKCSTLLISHDHKRATNINLFKWKKIKKN